MKNNTVNHSENALTNAGSFNAINNDVSFISTAKQHEKPEQIT